MPTLNQLIRHGREEKRRTDRTRASVLFLSSFVAGFFGRFLGSEGTKSIGARAATIASAGAGRADSFPITPDQMRLLNHLSRESLLLHGNEDLR